MTDLPATLEKAARAMGFTPSWNHYRVSQTHPGLTALIGGTVRHKWWNLTVFSAHCSEMEAKLNLDICWSNSRVIVSCQHGDFTEAYEDHKSKNHARMYSSTKAAASLGEDRK